MGRRVEITLNREVFFAYIYCLLVQELTQIGGDGEQQRKVSDAINSAPHCCIAQLTVHRVSDELFISCFRTDHGGRY